jgi:hypothetical protein
MNRKSRKKKDIIKVIQKENYFEYVNRTLKTFFTNPASLIYTSLAFLGIAVYWYEDGFVNMLRVLFLLINASSIAFFLAEILVSIIIKKIDKYSIISKWIVILILTFISFFFFNENFRYWSFSLGLILFIPIIINITFNKIRIWLNFKDKE